MLPVLSLFSTSQVMKYSIHTHSYVLDKYSNKHSLLINTHSLYRHISQETGASLGGDLYSKGSPCLATGRVVGSVMS